MNGIAGTGKTTIAYTLAEELESRGQLAASFFCTRTSTECGDPGRIVPTIVYQLARQSTPFQLALSSILGRDPDIGSLNASAQFKLLLVDPLRDRDLRGQMPQNLVVVVDALDECSNGGAVEIILDMLFRFGEYLPLKIQTRAPHCIYTKLRNPSWKLDAGRYLAEELAFMSPTTDQTSQLARLASNFFIYAATARLATMLDLNSTSTKRLSAIDSLYLSILEDAVDEDELEPEEKHTLLLVLWTVICAREPMTLSKIATLTGLSDVKERKVEWHPPSMHRSRTSCLTALGQSNFTATRTNIGITSHASFPDFMFDRSRSKQFYCDEDQHRHYLASRCFQIMKAQLRFNICDLDSSYLPDNEVTDLENRISQNISSDLEFACQHWEYYLQMSPPSQPSYDMLDDFVSNSLLFWMEVLSLKRYIRLGRSDLFGVGEWLKATGGPPHLIEFVEDACRFIDHFEPWLISPRHLYISALPLSNKSSHIFMRYSGRFQGFINIETIRAQSDIKPAGLDIEGSWPRADVFTYSDDGTRIGCVFKNGTLAVWSALDGTIIGSHTVPFCDVGPQIADFSSNCSSALILNRMQWNMALWEIGEPIRLGVHPRGDLKLLGYQAITPLPGNTSYAGFDVFNAVFVREYDVRAPEKRSRLGEHTQGNLGDSPSRIKPSTDGSRLTITHCSGEVFEWNFGDEQSPRSLLGPLFAGQVTTLSQNCKFAVRGPLNQEFQMWDLEQNTYCFSFHPSSNLSIVQISSDGALALMEDGISHQVWNIRTGGLVAGPFKEVRRCCLSPYGTQVAFQDGSGNIHTRRIIPLDSTSESRITFAERIPVPQLVGPSNRGVVSLHLSENCVIHFSNTQTEFKLSDDFCPIWTIRTDGWVTVDDSELLFWLPPEECNNLSYFRREAIERWNHDYYQKRSFDFSQMLLGKRWHEMYRGQR
ncbi:hypothetical protein RSAG8_11821, partial [Rhizoctonia solani AG-8 WAC10335]